MPVARPIMLTMLMANTETSNVWPTSAVRPTAMVMAIRLRRIGSPAAITAPNTISRMTSAMGTPMPSPFCRSDSAVWLKSLLMLAAPVTSVSNPPLPSALCTTSWTLSMFFSAWVRSPAMTTGMIAVWPSAEMSVLSPPWNALTVLSTTPGPRAAICFCSPSTSLRKAGAVAAVAVERTMTTSLAFCGMFMRCWRRSRPRCESGFPRKLYCAVRVPGSTSTMTATMATRATAQSASVSHGRRADPRASVVVESRMVSLPCTAPPGAEAGLIWSE